MNNLNRLQWPLIIGMAALALIRPFLSITGLMDSLGRPAGPLLVTALLSVVWVAIAAFGSVRQPVLTLTFTGLAYGVFAIVISAILSPILEGQLSGPATNPFAFVSVLATNALWGLVLGLIAQALQPREQAERG